MPHYRDGSAVTIGDMVRGKTHGILHEVTGIVVNLSGVGGCNCMVSYVCNLGKKLHVDPSLNLILVGIQTDYADTSALEKVT